MVLGDRGSRRRCLLVWMSATAVLATMARLALPGTARTWSARRSLATVPLDLALVDMAACVVLACVAWAWVALSAAVLDAWRGAARHEHGPCWQLPAGARRVVLVACGVALTSTAAVPAHADAGRSRHPDGAAVLSGLPLPDRAVAPSRHPRRAHDDALVVVVRPGDSLWSIAQRDLSPGASDAAVVSRWQAIYAANRSRIGPDPDLIEPGHRLRLPRKDRS